jgi:hypothetical protein
VIYASRVGDERDISGKSLERDIVVETDLGLTERCYERDIAQTRPVLSKRSIST